MLLKLLKYTGKHTFSSKRHKFCQIDMLDFVIVAKINMKMTKILTDWHVMTKVIELFLLKLLK